MIIEESIFPIELNCDRSRIIKNIKNFAKIM